MRWLKLKSILFLLLFLSLIFLVIGNKNRAYAYASYNTSYRGIYVHNDYGVTPSLETLPFVQGAHFRFSWRKLNPAYGVYDFTLVDKFLERVKKLHKKAVIGVMVRCQDKGKGVTGEDSCVPGWALASIFDPVKEDYQGKQFLRLNFGNRVFQEKYRIFIEKFAKKYVNNPVIAAVEIPIGYWGESNPYASSTSIPDRNQQIDAYKKYLSQKEWENYQRFLIDAYTEAFASAKYPLMVIYTGAYLDKYEHARLGKLIIEKGLGFHHTGLEANFSFGNSIRDEKGKLVCGQDVKEGDPNAYVCPWALTERNGRKLPGSFEFNNWYPRHYFHLSQTEHVWWSVLNALDKHARVIYAQPKNLEDKNTHPAYEFFDMYAGKSALNTPAAWIALRTYISHNFSPSNRLPTKPFCSDEGNYEWFIYQNMNADGNSIKAYDCNENYPARSFDEKDWYGAFSRRTDISDNKPYLYFFLDRNYASQHNNPYYVEVVYWDGESEDKGTRWRFVYNSQEGKKVGKEISLEGTGSWKKVKFKIDDAKFDRGLRDRSGKAGNDFALYSLGPKDVIFQFVSMSSSLAEGANLPNPHQGNGEENTNNEQRNRSGSSNSSNGNNSSSNWLKDYLWGEKIYSSSNRDVTISGLVIGVLTIIFIFFK